MIVLISVIKILLLYEFLVSVSIYILPLMLFVLFISFFFAVMVWNFRGNMYRILGLLGISGLLKGLSSFDSWSSYSATNWAFQLLLGYIPAILIVILAYYIGFKVFPYYGFWGMLQEKKMNL
jgi:hypothetical protein